MRAFGAPVNSRAKKTARWRADRLSLGLSGPLTGAPPSKKTTAHQDQAGEAGADDGTGHSYRFSKSNLRYAVQTNCSCERNTGDEFAARSCKRDITCEVCSSNLTGRSAAERRHVGGAGPVRHGVPVR
jgi:hypothetical protein